MNRLIVAATLCAAVLQLVPAATVCGKQGLRSLRIYGGKNATLGEWPWHATLGYKKKPYCGGTLISDRWLVTAAHCFDPSHGETVAVKRDPKQWAVHLGFSKLGFVPEESSAITVVPSRILVHENYTNYLGGSDIALVELPHPVNFTRFISPICLPEAGHRFHLRSTCYATGLQDVPEGGFLPITHHGHDSEVVSDIVGRLFDIAQASKSRHTCVVIMSVPLDSARYLEKVAQKLIGWRTCNCIYNTHSRPEQSNPAKPGMLCITEGDGKAGPCVGDSGGPVVCNEDDTWFLAGAISFSEGCHLLNSPTILTAVSFYQDWISRWTNSTAAFSPQTIVVTDDVDNDTCSDLLSNQTLGCGVSEADISGTSSPGPWPWQVDLWRGDHRACGGALISATWVITAAECFVSPDSSESPPDWLVSVATGTPAMQNFTVQKISIHGSYVSHESGNNVALVQLSHPAPLGPFIQPICLPESSHLMPYEASCWHTGGGGPLPDGQMGPPRGVKLELIGPNQCNCIYSQPKSANSSVSILPGMTCAARLKGNGSQCLSDSGGPLACKENGTWFLIGVRSFGGECEKDTETALPGVFTQLAKYEDWISRETRDGFFIPQIYTPPAEMDSDRCSYNSPRGCGRSVTSPGSEPFGDATETSWPWQASLQLYDTHVCSAVLIAETWLLTAAHCIPRFTSIRDYTVLLSRQLQYGTNPREMTRTIKSVVYHPDYKAKTGENDLALVEMDYGITFSDYVMPICLPSDQTLPPSTGCWVSGWGRLYPTESISFLPPLRHLEVSLLDGKQCGGQGNASGGSSQGQLCVAAKSDNTFSCLFDSSAPLVCQTRPGGPWFLFGVGSHKSPSVKNECPGNFTEVLPKMSWIRQVVPRSDLNGLQGNQPIPDVGPNGTTTADITILTTSLLNNGTMTAGTTTGSTPLLNNGTTTAGTTTGSTPLLNNGTTTTGSSTGSTPMLNNGTTTAGTTTGSTPLLNNGTTTTGTTTGSTPLLNNGTTTAGTTAGSIPLLNNGTMTAGSTTGSTPLLNNGTMTAGTTTGSTLLLNNGTTTAGTTTGSTPLRNSPAITPHSTDTTHPTSGVPPGGEFNPTAKVGHNCLDHSGQDGATCVESTIAAQHNIRTTSSSKGSTQKPGSMGKTQTTTRSASASFGWSWLLHSFLSALCLGLC